jgi:tRNA(Ile)-lysidine synthase
MDLLQAFKQHWAAQYPQLDKQNTRLLLAVSGGVDSVVLLSLVAACGFPYEIAHVNFQLRREESERDEAFVTALASKYGKTLLLKKVDTAKFATDNKLSVQEAAREIRYSWFRELIAGWNAATKNLIVTAHHADDNIETVLMHFFRGTGIEGLAGMQHYKPEFSLIRPLLPFRKEDLHLYAAEMGLKFVEDSSNRSDKYTRNFFRNQIIPLVKEVYPQTEQNLVANIDRFNEIAALYRETIDQKLQKLITKKENEWHIPVLAWKKAMPLHTITWELTKDFGFTSAQVPEIIKLLDASNGAFIASSSHRIIHNRNWMIISPLAGPASGHIIVQEQDEHILLPEGNIKVTLLDAKPAIIPDSPNEAFIDQRMVKFPLLIRKVKTGDYFYPLGMTKKKKISRFLIDLKLSRTQKEQVWVVESDKKIIWVIGYRLDNRVRLTDSTTALLQLSFQK